MEPIVLEYRERTGGFVATDLRLDPPTTVTLALPCSTETGAPSDGSGGSTRYKSVLFPGSCVQLVSSGSSKNVPLVVHDVLGSGRFGDVYFSAGQGQRVFTARMLAPNAPDTMSVVDESMRVLGLGQHVNIVSVHDVRRRQADGAAVVLLDPMHLAVPQDDDDDFSLPSLTRRTEGGTAKDGQTGTDLKDEDEDETEKEASEGDDGQGAKARQEAGAGHRPERGFFLPAGLPCPWYPLAEALSWTHPNSWVLRYRRKCHVYAEMALCAFSGLLRGLEWVHSSDVVHQNVTMHTVLVNDQGDCKISDFRLATRGLRTHKSSASGLLYDGEERASSPQLSVASSNASSAVYASRSMSTARESSRARSHLSPPPGGASSGGSVTNPTAPIADPTTDSPPALQLKSGAQISPPNLSSPARDDAATSSPSGTPPMVADSSISRSHNSSSVDESARASYLRNTTSTGTMIGRSATEEGSVAVLVHPEDTQAFLQQQRMRQDAKKNPTGVHGRKPPFSKRNIALEYVQPLNASATATGTHRNYHSQNDQPNDDSQRLQQRHQGTHGAVYGTASINLPGSGLASTNLSNRFRPGELVAPLRGLTPAYVAPDTICEMQQLLGHTSISNVAQANAAQHAIQVPACNQDLWGAAVLALQLFTQSESPKKCPPAAHFAYRMLDSAYEWGARQNLDWVREVQAEVGFSDEFVDAVATEDRPMTQWPWFRAGGDKPYDANAELRLIQRMKLERLIRRELRPVPLPPHIPNLIAQCLSVPSHTPYSSTTGVSALAPRPVSAAAILWAMIHNRAEIDSNDSLGQHTKAALVFSMQSRDTPREVNAASRPRRDFFEPISTNDQQAGPSEKNDNAKCTNSNQNKILSTPLADDDVSEFLAEYQNKEGHATRSLLYARAAVTCGELLFDKDQRDLGPRSLAWLEHGLDIIERKTGKESAECAAVLRRISHICAGQGAYERALSHRQRALSIHEIRSGGRNEVASVTSLMSIAQYYSAQGDHLKALEHHQRALAMQQRIVKSGDHADLVPVLAAIAANQVLLANLSAAVSAYQRALDICNKVTAAREAVRTSEAPALSHSSPARASQAEAETGATPKSVGPVESGSNCTTSAELCYSMIPFSSFLLSAIAQLQADHGHQDKAFVTRKANLRVCRNALGKEEHLRIADVRTELANSYFHRGEYLESLACHALALQTRERELGEMDAKLYSNMKGMGDVYTRTGQFREAVLCYKRALELVRLDSVFLPHTARGRTHLGRTQSSPMLRTSPASVGATVPLTPSMQTHPEDAHGPNYQGGHAFEEEVGKSNRKSKRGMLPPPPVPRLENPPPRSTDSMADTVSTTTSPDSAPPVPGSQLGIAELGGGESGSAVSGAGARASADTGAGSSAAPQHHAVPAGEEADGEENPMWTEVMLVLHNAEEIATVVRTGAIASTADHDYCTLVRALGLYTSLASVYSTMGEFEKSLVCHERSLSCRERVWGTTHVELVPTLASLFTLYHRIGVPDLANAHRNRALAIQPSSANAESPSTTDQLHALAIAHANMGSPETALKHAAAALVQLSGTGSTHDTRSVLPVQSAILNTVGMLHTMLDDHKAGRKAFARALALLKMWSSTSSFSTKEDQTRNSRSSPSIKLDLAALYSNMAASDEESGRLEHARHMYTKAFDLRREVQGDDHLDVATVASELAGLLSLAEEYAEAERLYSMALRIRTAVLGPHHPDVATLLTNLGTLAYFQQRFDLSLERNRDALRIREHALGVHHRDCATNWNNMASVHAVRGRLRQAARCCSMAMRVDPPRRKRWDPEVATTLTNAGVLYARRNRYRKARRCYEWVSAMRAALMGEEHGLAVAAQMRIAELALHTNEPRKAAEAHRSAIQAQRRLVDRLAAKERVVVHKRMRSVESLEEDVLFPPAGVRGIVRTAASANDGDGDAQHWSANDGEPAAQFAADMKKLFAARELLATLLFRQGDVYVECLQLYEPGIEYLREALQIQRQLESYLLPDDPAWQTLRHEHANTLEVLGDTYSALGQPDTAALAHVCYRRAERILAAMVSEDDRSLRALRNALHDEEKTGPPQDTKAIDRLRQDLAITRDRVDIEVAEGQWGPDAEETSDRVSAYDSDAANAFSPTASEMDILDIAESGLATHFTGVGAGDLEARIISKRHVVPDDDDTTVTTATGKHPCTLS